MITIPVCRLEIQKALAVHPDNLIDAIERAFANVKLDDGIGVFEAEALDDCVSDKLLARARAKDIGDDWRALSDDVISEHYSAMAFMDQKGLRYAIPAYMRFAVRYWKTSNSASVDHVIYTLARDEDWDFLTEEQKQVIADFLRYMVVEADEDVDTWQASLAYEKYWARYASAD